MKIQIDYRTNWGESIAIKTDNSQDLIFFQCTENGHTWTTEIKLPEGTQYRYCVVKEGQIIRQEMMCMPHCITSKNAPIEDTWREVQRVAGIAVPVFSLRTKGSQGVGDFGDLKTLIDWADKMGMKAIQILPINDTTISGTWQDSYPYNSISTFALHPMYMDLRQLPQGCLTPNPSPGTKVLPTGEDSEGASPIDYEQVNINKRRAIAAAFDKEGTKVLRTKAFKDWFAKNEHWLVAYAKFRVQKMVYAFLDSYGVELYYYTQYKLHCQLKAAADYAREKGIILKGDIPIGVSRDGVDAYDHPELFNLDQSTGAPPDFFSQDGQNWGFPTYNWDEMAKDGYQWWKNRMQNMANYFSAYRIDHILGFFRIWAIPTKKIHGRSPKYRELHHAANTISGLEGQFQPALPLSIDTIHYNGLWVSDEQFDELFVEDFKQEHTYHPRITAHNTEAFRSLNDEQKNAFNRIHEHFFFRRHNQYWYNEAMKKLPALTATNLMICCGEDLGMVPECVPWVMKQLNILSLEIQNMPKQLGTDFADPAYYPEMSVCTISSHDTQTLRGWWEEDRQRAQRLYNNVLHLHGEAPQKLPGWIAERIICQHLASPSSLCIITLQDWLGINEDLRYPEATAERINIPANPRHYWRWRMHLNLEDLISNDKYNNHIKELITAYGR